ncbi:hypothetical protein H0H87_000240 [Tephrocybe sp. NHM501043]|nr:hypothetical protein H0H87_000240 [Tephrocybe sp. NHM501043]
MSTSIPTFTRALPHLNRFLYLTRFLTSTFAAANSLFLWSTGGKGIFGYFAPIPTKVIAASPPSRTVLATPPLGVPYLQLFFVLLLVLCPTIVVASKTSYSVGTAYPPLAEEPDPRRLRKRHISPAQQLDKAIAAVWALPLSRAFRAIVYALIMRECLPTMLELFVQPSSTLCSTLVALIALATLAPAVIRRALVRLLRLMRDSSIRNVATTTVQEHIGELPGSSTNAATELPVPDAANFEEETDGMAIIGEFEVPVENNITLPAVDYLPQLPIPDEDEIAFFATPDVDDDLPKLPLLQIPGEDEIAFFAAEEADKPDISTEDDDIEAAHESLHSELAINSIPSIPSASMDIALSMPLPDDEDDLNIAVSTPLPDDEDEDENLNLAVSTPLLEEDDTTATAVLPSSLIDTSINTSWGSNDEDVELAIMDHVLASKSYDFSADSSLSRNGDSLPGGGEENGEGEEEEEEYWKAADRANAELLDQCAVDDGGGVCLGMELGLGVMVGSEGVDTSVLDTPPPAKEESKPKPQPRIRSSLFSLTSGPTGARGVGSWR